MEFEESLAPKDSLKDTFKCKPFCCFEIMVPMAQKSVARSGLVKYS